MRPPASAIELVGKERMLRTESSVLEAVRRGLFTVSEADALQASLALNRYMMPVAGFSEVL